MLRKLFAPIFAVCLLAVTAQAEETKAPSFIKVTKNDQGEVVSLDTGVVRYEKTVVGFGIPPAPGSGIEHPTRKITIDLIGVIHIGDRRYYNGLNKLFKDYDSLCYELVAEKGTVIPKGGRKENEQHPLAMIQKMAKSFLQLEHQLEVVDYTKENFVHADMTPDQMAAAMAKRGDNQLTVALGVFADSIRKQNLQQQKLQNVPVSEQPEQLTLEDLLNLFIDPAGPKKLKRHLAMQFGNADNMNMGPTIEQLLITDRNAEAMKVVNEQIKKGDANIGLFYGAAHMPDFHERLLKQGFKPVKVGYITAWDLRVEPAGVEDILRTLERVNQLQGQ